MLLIDRIEELRMTFKELHRLADLVDTRIASDQLYQDVYEAFGLLKPFSWSSKVVKHIALHKFPQSVNRYGTSEIKDEDLVVNDWVGLRSTGRWGSSRAYPITDRLFFFNVIKAFGLVLSEKLRGPITGDFLELYDQTKKLEEYSSLLLNKDFERNYKYLDGTRYGYVPGSPVLSNPIYGIALETNVPGTIFLLKNKVKDLEKELRKETLQSIELSTFEDIYKIEQVKDDLIELYKEAEVKVVEIRDHNEPILEEISRTVSAYDFAKALKHKRDD